MRWDQSLPAPTQVAPLQDCEAGETDGLTPIAGGGSPSGDDPPTGGGGYPSGADPHCWGRIPVRAGSSLR